MPRKCLKKNSSGKRELLIKVEDTLSSRPCAVYFFIGFQLSCQRTWAFSYVNIGSLEHTNPKTNRRYPISASFKGVKARYSIGILFERNNWPEWPLKLLLPVTEYKRVALLLPESYLAASALGHVKQTGRQKLHNNNIGVMGLLKAYQIASLSTITMVRHLLACFTCFLNQLFSFFSICCTLQNCPCVFLFSKLLFTSGC